ncbi:HMG box protein [Aspergillus sclerotioniger CBS 115572]|uniref:HMG box protein n=1 Tax=Aspergillus sclerotioniger CBS 115572 TaxID=1450535 RepID=A0A317WDQ9_9EURO|nr:HMG box protein [Aspergillus sclerotioniger CBS 115572]PWY83198.1 HMG box protein [Aspergillus sclerotioniger CBS 115572]
MPLNLARCGGGVLQHLQLSSAFSRPIRQAISQSHVRCMSLATLGRFSTPNVRYAPVSVALSGRLTNGYATAATPKKRTTKKADPESPEAPKAKKVASKAKKAKTTKSKKATKKPRAKKVLTEEQKEAKKEAKIASDQRKLVKELKAAVLSPPKRLTNYFTLAMFAKLEEVKKEGKELAATDAFKEAAERAKAMSDAERKKFTDAAAANKEAHQEEYEKWLNSHTPLEIKQANMARRRLAQIQNKKFFPIHDPRLVKRAKVGYLFYAEERHQAGDLKHMTVPERGVRIAEEWRGMTDAEKQKYVRLQEADTERYFREYKEVYGEDAPNVGKNLSK